MHIQTLPARESTLRTEGAVLLDSALGPAALREIIDATTDLPPDRAGIRLHGVDAIRRILGSTGCVGRIAEGFMGQGCRPVRAILFDKSPASNWSLAWHQDRVIVVKSRIDVDGFGPWTRKSGLLHVMPPAWLLARMLTLRVHLDPVTATNAPLLIAPGSHRLGRIPETDIPATVDRCGTTACLAKPGDVWVYATPILHASEAAREPARRRVLQVDYANSTLPGGLEWLGV